MNIRTDTRPPGDDAPAPSRPAGCSPPPVCRGFCRDCGRDHLLLENGARMHCLELMAHFRRHGSIDLTPGATRSDPRLATDWLYGEARGKMFGVLECLDRDGSIVVLRAFSGQYGGLWEVDGWAPPLFDSRELEEISAAVEKEIKRLGREMAKTTDPELRVGLRRQRRQLSRDLMRRIHGLYRLTNFHGNTASLTAAFAGSGGIPTGTGDCCAPKLLNLAARRGLIPLGMAEFYWGRNNRSASREEGRFYPSCQDKCQPILGFLLCGLHDHVHDHAA